MKFEACYHSSKYCIKPGSKQIIRVKPEHFLFCRLDMLNFEQNNSLKSKGTSKIRQVKYKYFYSASKNVKITSETPGV